jgi:hypothetical protein
MGSVVGEKFVRAVEYCLEHRMPLVCFSASGGARMQEALYSLLQMAKTSAALKRLSEARLPFISVMTDPTTGGVSASLAMLGDINIGEPKALIGFAGPRVIQQTVRETLPEGFQRSEFLLEHGALDMIVDRRELRDRIGAMLRLLTGKEPAAANSRHLLPRSLDEWFAHQAQVHPQPSTWGSSGCSRCSQRLDGGSPPCPSSPSPVPTARARSVATCAAILARRAAASARSPRRICATTASASAS